MSDIILFVDKSVINKNIIKIKVIQKNVDHFSDS